VRILVLALCLTALAQDSRDWKLTTTIPLDAALHHVQGIDVEGNTLWVSSVDRKTKKGWVSRFQLPSGKLVRQAEVQQGERFHPGGMTLDGDAIWVPVAEYHRAGPTTVQRRDKSTLALLSSFDVPDHIGCIAAAPEFLIGGNWDSRKLYRWRKSGEFVSAADNPRTTSYQDLKIVAGELLGSGNVSAKAGAIEWLALDGSFRLIRRIEMGVTDRGLPYTHEGMTIRGGKLFLLPEDDPSRLFIFERTR
jgi:hypothetical protein